MKLLRMADTAPQIIEAIRAEIEKKLGAEKTDAWTRRRSYVQNAVPINALQKKAQGVTGTYAMAAYATDSNNREFAAIITVEQHSGRIEGIDIYDVAHAVSGRQKRGSQADTKSQGVYPIKATKISIAELLRIVNNTHQSIWAEDVLHELGESRNPAGDYSDKVKFSAAAQAEQGEQQELRYVTSARTDLLRGVQRVQQAKNLAESLNGNNSAEKC